LPVVIRGFMDDLGKDIAEQQIKGLDELYTKDWQKHSDKQYKTARWPDYEMAKDFLGEDPRTELVYKELFYRHLFGKNLTLQPKDRLDAWENYINLFRKLEDDLKAEVQTGTAPEKKLALPLSYLWDIVDEFVFQYQRFELFKKHAFQKDVKADKDLCTENPTMWEASAVHHHLNVFVDISNLEYLMECKRNKTTPDSSKEMTGEMSQFIGYFSQVQIVRLTILFGDFDGCLDEVTKLDYGCHDPLYFRSIGCHVSLYYYLGFAFIMQKRFSDAIGLFSQILYFHLRVGQRFPPLGHLYDVQTKNMDRMWTLLIIAMSMGGDGYHNIVEDSVLQVIDDKHSEKRTKLRDFDNHDYYDEVFVQICPKFVPICEEVDGKLNFADGYDKHKESFKAILAEQKIVPVVVSYLKLYTGISLKKLADLCKIDSVEEMKQKLEYVKASFKQDVIDGGQIAGGRKAYCSDIAFKIENRGGEEVVEVEILKKEKDYTKIFDESNKILKEYVAMTAGA